MWESTTNISGNGKVVPVAHERKGETTYRSAAPVTSHSRNQTVNSRYPSCGVRISQDFFVSTASARDEIRRPARREPYKTTLL